MDKNDLILIKVNSLVKVLHPAGMYVGKLARPYSGGKTVVMTDVLKIMPDKDDSAKMFTIQGRVVMRAEEYFIEEMIEGDTWFTQYKEKITGLTLPLPSRNN